MKKVFKVLEEAVIGSILFAGTVALVALAVVSIFKH